MDLTTDNFQLRRVEFVPAQRIDASPVPKGVDIIVLNGVLPVRSIDSCEPCYEATRLCAEELLLALEQDADKLQRDTGAVKPKMHQHELFREQDVLLHWKTVQKTVRVLLEQGCLPVFKCHLHLQHLVLMR